MIIATSLEECIAQVQAWKEGMESKGLHVNMGKTNFMDSGPDLDVLHDPVMCAVLEWGVHPTFAQNVCIGSTRNSQVSKP